MIANGRVRTSFGKRIKAIRASRRLSQEQFANIVDIDRTYISGIERGVRNPSLLVLAQISRGLQLSLSELFEDVIA